MVISVRSYWKEAAVADKEQGGATDSDAPNGTSTPADVSEPPVPEGDVASIDPGPIGTVPLLRNINLSEVRDKLRGEQAAEGPSSDGS